MRPGDEARDRPTHRATERSLFVLSLVVTAETALPSPRRRAVSVTPSRVRRPPTGKAETPSFWAPGESTNLVPEPGLPDPVEGASARRAHGPVRPVVPGPGRRLYAAVQDVAPPAEALVLRPKATGVAPRRPALLRSLAGPVAGS